MTDLCNRTCSDFLVSLVFGAVPFGSDALTAENVYYLCSPLAMCSCAGMHGPFGSWQTILNNITPILISPNTTKNIFLVLSFPHMIGKINRK